MLVISPFFPISIHAPREGSDIIPTMLTLQHFLFQSTLPARGATAAEKRGYIYGKFQSTLPARGATEGGEEMITKILISIHAPREGSDLQLSCRYTDFIYFNPRSPRGERQYFCFCSCVCSLDFNPRSPRGERPLLTFSKKCCLRFQSTLPARGATPACIFLKQHFLISIHAPREGSDCSGVGGQFLRQNFNPRSPRGERLFASVVLKR